MAVVLKDFICKKTRQLHRAGEVYEGDRTEELAKLGYLGETDDTGAGSNHMEWPKHGGGGYYELSNGKKIKGKDEAFAAQAEIDDASDE